MNIINPNNDSPIEEAAALKVVIIYEDFDTALRAKKFTEDLEAKLGCACRWADSIWRSELLESPEIADEAALDASDCDYLIVSLRGDHVLPFAARQWIESQLDGAAERNAGLIVLSDSNLGKWRVVEGTRHYFRGVCAERGVAFFSHGVNPHQASDVTSLTTTSRWMAPGYPIGLPQPADRVLLHE